MEAVPIYQTCLMIMWILSGLIMLNERQFYSGLQLMAIFGAISLCLVGITLLMRKRKMLKAKAKGQLEKNSLLIAPEQPVADQELQKYTTPPTIVR